MTPTTMGIAATLLGLAALAALLYALQRLRVRHEERVVVTSLFWNEALEESRARTLVERFRRPLTYLMVLAASALLWFGVARFDGQRETGDRYVFLLDASADTAVAQPGGRTHFEVQVDGLRDALARVPSDRTEVLFVGDVTVPLLSPGDDAALFESRLAGLGPRLAPSRVDAVMRSRGAVAEGNGRTRFVVLGESSISDATREALGDRCTLEMIALENVPPPGARLATLGVSPAASGTWGQVDVQVTVLGTDAPQLSFTLDGNAFTPANVSRKDVGEGQTHTFLRDVPANGGTLAAHLAAGGSPLRSTASVELPDIAPIRVSVEGQAPGAKAVRAILEFDPAVELVEDATAADVVVGEAQGRPSLVLLPAERAQATVFVRDPAAASPEPALHAALGELGFDRIDASRLATEVGAPVTASAAHSDVRRIELWSELFDATRCGFVESRACPQIVARAVRWLADVEPIVPYRAAGLPVPSRLGVDHDASRTMRFAADGVVHEEPSGLGAESHPIEAAVLPGAGAWRPYTWILFLALGLLLVEWVLFQRGRIA